MAHEGDKESLCMLREALAIIECVASGSGPLAAASPGTVRRADALLGVCPLPPCILRHAAPADDPVLRPTHPDFKVTADALSRMLNFLSDEVSVDEVLEALKKCDDGSTFLTSVRQLCGHAGYHVRHSRDGANNVIPPAGPDTPVGRFGTSAVVVSLVLLASGSGPFAVEAKAAVLAILVAVDTFNDLLEQESTNELVKSHLEVALDGEIIGNRRYLPLHGDRYNSIPKGDVRNAVYELKRVCALAIAVILRVGGFADGNTPDLDSMTILIGDAKEQLQHFDVLFLRQLVMLLSAGLSTLVFPVLPRALCETSDMAMRRIGAMCNETVPRLTHRGEFRISHFESLVYVTNACGLLSSTSPSHRGDLQYSHLIDGVCPAGLAGIIESSGLHNGPGPKAISTTELLPVTASDSSSAIVETPAIRTDVPISRNTPAFLALEVESYKCLPDAVTHVSKSGRTTAPRMTLFCTMKPSDIEYRKGKAMLCREGDTNSEQHREEVVLDNLGLYDSLPACYIKCFERGYREMPRFLYYADSKRYRITYALLKAWTQSKDGNNEFAADGRRKIVLISAAFRAVFAEEAPASRYAEEGLRLAEEMVPLSACEDGPLSDSEA